MTVCQLDFETRGTIELKRSSVYPYARHHDTAIWLMAYAFDEEEIQLWHPGEPIPERLVAHAAEGGEFRAWNAEFERVMWREVLVRRFRFPQVPLEQWHCTAAEAAVMALPRALEKAAAVLHVSERKDHDGHRLMLKMCRPRSFDKDTGAPIWWDDPVKLARLGQYCLQDVRTERAVAKAILRLNPHERAIYLMNQRMNDRGVYIDLELTRAAKEMAEHEIERQNALLAEATDGTVERVTQVARLSAWLAERGTPTASLDKRAVEELLTNTLTLTPDVQQALEARQEASKSSVAKLDAIIDCIGLDQRCRGLLLYHGAGTGREAGKHVQPQNMPRGNVVADWLKLKGLTMEDMIQDVIASNSARLEEAGILAVLSAMLRSIIRAAPGQVLLAGDFVAIEARVLAWLAQQQDLVEDFAKGRNVYKEMGSVIFHRPADEIIKPSDDYTVSKNTVLGCGFGMGAKKFREQLFKQAGLRVDAALAETAVNAYRMRFSKIPDYWTAANACAIAAVEHPGEIQWLGKQVRMRRKGGYLSIILPARRSLWYAMPKVVDRETPWHTMQPAVEFSGVNGYTHQWERMALYGGLIVENIVQGIARDLLMAAMRRLEAAGFPPVLSVHDEVVCEVPTDATAIAPDCDGITRCDATEAVFDHYMKQVPAWATGCPIDTETWRGERYRK